MRHKLLAGDTGGRCVILALDTGEEAFNDISNFAMKEGVPVAAIMAIGAFRAATLTFFEFDTRNGKRIPVEVQSEELA
ncbi:DUF296 domain-containing protein [Sinorhizobium sp. RAC02]|uniref:PCC domain-containing protein n=1 Tax=Sinorhizobium sp. RAC02 TaxID=1842534 RepID=UPI00083CC03B|nr:DUF296 domain-containing protein [Sinorhizobium sp. RAC02]AOF93056.1 hypothetical protein BSY16_5124 [Sinorhizobium sp. RAC02]